MRRGEWGGVECGGEEEGTHPDTDLWHSLMKKGSSHLDELEDTSDFSKLHHKMHSPP